MHIAWPDDAAMAIRIDMFDRAVIDDADGLRRVEVEVGVAKTADVKARRDTAVDDLATLALPFLLRLEEATGETTKAELAQDQLLGLEHLQSVLVERRDGLPRRPAGLVESVPVHEDVKHGRGDLRLQLLAEIAPMHGFLVGWHVVMAMRRRDGEGRLDDGGGLPGWPPRRRSWW